MADRADDIMDEAIGWSVRLRDADAATWEAFTHWLEADSAHLAAYERVALLDEDLDGLRAAPRQHAVEPVSRPAVGRRWILGGGAAAAAAIAATAASILMLTPSAAYTIRTEPGQSRVITLEGGSVIHLNGASAITLHPDDPRFAELENGEALFSVVSKPEDPFRVEAGPATIRNLGTVFNVELAPAVVEVGVAEGVVAFNASGHALKLSAGEVVRVIDGALDTERMEPATIGAWTAGELSYSSATLGEVAQDLSRTSGISIRAEPAVAGRQFSGTIIIDEDRERLRRRLAALLNVDIKVAQEEWILAAPDR